MLLSVMAKIKITPSKLVPCQTCFHAATVLDFLQKTKGLICGTKLACEPFPNQNEESQYFPLLQSTEQRGTSGITVATLPCKIKRTPLMQKEKKAVKESKTK